MLGEQGGAAAGTEAARNSGEDDKSRVDEGERSLGGNRWPREETVALINIRADMDDAFRESSSKGPLWEEVSRKLADLGYHRSAKKCKEKFENVYKYHKRTKEGRGGKQDGKTYRFFQQLEALKSHHHPSLPPPTPPPPRPAAPPPPPQPSNLPAAHETVPSTTFPPNINATPGVAVNPIILPSPSTSNVNPTTNAPQIAIPSSFPNISSDFVSNSNSSSTSSGEGLGGGINRKRKWREFFQTLIREMVERQEQMQKKFLETIENREQERAAREEFWRKQEMLRINREREILAQERSMAAAKDTAVLAFLQKISQQHNVPMPPPTAPQPPVSSVPQPPQPPPVSSGPLQLPPPPQRQPIMSFDIVKTDNGGNNSNSNSHPPTTSSRWPKAEVEALIQLRKCLDAKYNENAPKGPLWEEISSGMRRLGYDRSAKRCKEKWENINKYFKKVKESNRKRPEDSKTCPYFHQLDALYREKNKMENNHDINSSSGQITPENAVPLMVRPEQQWPPQQDSSMKDVDSEQTDQNQEDDEEEDDASDHYELVANRPTSDQ